MTGSSGRGAERARKGSREGQRQLLVGKQGRVLKPRGKHLQLWAGLSGPVLGWFWAGAGLGGL